MNATDSAYCAGVVDAEASIEGDRIAVTNRELSWLEQLQETMHCGIIYDHADRKSVKRDGYIRPRYWRLVIRPEQERVRLLREILPYLRLKRQRAEAVLDRLLVPCGTKAKK